MTSPFDPEQGLIVVTATMQGPIDSAVVKLALDTGATHSILHPDALARVGYQPDESENRVQVTTGSGLEYAPVVTVSKLAALGKVCAEFYVTAVALPETATVDGVLGLDFFRGHVLTLDFQQGRISFQ